MMTAVSLVTIIIFFQRLYNLGLNPTKFQTNCVHGLRVSIISSWEGLVGLTLVLPYKKEPSLGR